MKATATKSAPATIITSNGKHSHLDVIQELHQDHQRVKELFFQFCQTDNGKEKEQLVKTILKELYVHATVEEEIVYPAIRSEVENADDIMDEADTEHHVVKLLMAELSDMKSTDDHFDSKVTVLGELVSHHVKEEEKEMFEKMKEADMNLDELGKEVAQRKEVLNKTGMPTRTSPIKTNSRTNTKKK